VKSSLFVKSFVSLFIPYPSDKIIKESDIRQDEIEGILSRLDLNRIAGNSKVDY
jgi:hypothetical protein